MNRELDSTINQIGVGVVGAGVMGRNHLHCLRAEGRRLVAVADSQSPSAEKLAEELEVPLFRDHRGLLDRDDVQAVAIATPTRTHYAIARDALRVGKHVLIEKPICASIDEAVALCRLADGCGLTVSVGLIERHNPPFCRAFQSLWKGDLGELISLKAQRLSPWPNRQLGIGPILDTGIHDLDAFHALAAAEATTVYGVARHVKRDDTEDLAHIEVQFANGVVGFAESSWLSPFRSRLLTVTCNGGVMEIDYLNGTLRIARNGGNGSSSGPPTPEAEVEQYGFPPHRSLACEHHDFLTSIVERRAPQVTARDGAESLRLALAALESCETGRPVWVGG